MSTAERLQEMKLKATDVSVSFESVPVANVPFESVPIASSVCVHAETVDDGFDDGLLTSSNEPRYDSKFKMKESLSSSSFETNFESNETE